MWSPYLFVHVLRANKTGNAIIIVITMPINMIWSVEPGIETGVGVGVGDAI